MKKALHITILCILMHSVSTSYAQVDSTRFYADSLANLDSANYKFLDDAIAYESREAVPNDSVLGTFYEFKAILNIYLDPSNALPVYYKAFESYLKAGAKEAAITCLETYQEVMKDLIADSALLDLNYKYGGATDSLLGYFSIDSVIRWSGDTAYVIMNGGLNQGVFDGSLGGVLSGNTLDTDRKNQVLGSVQVLNAKANISIASFYFYEGMKKHDLIKGDLIAVRTAKSRLAADNILSKLSNQNIYFNTLDKIPHYNAIDMNSAQSVMLTELILESMLEEIYVGGRYARMTSDYDTSFITGGKFDGQLWASALLNTRPMDIELFLEYVLEYPFTYMGVQQDFLTSYLNWLISAGPVEYLSNFDDKMIKYVNALPYEEDSLKNLSDDFAFYLKTAFKSGVDLYRDFFKPTDNEEHRSQFAQKMVWLSDHKLTDTLHTWMKLYKAYEYAGEEDYDKSIKIFTAVIDSAVMPEQGYYGRGYVYFEQESYKLSIKDCDSAIALENEYIANLCKGNKGAALFRQGNWKKAKPYFRMAYESDTNSDVWNLNMGIAHMFDGKEDSATYFFEKALTMVTKKSEYTHLLEVFDFNMEKGWLEETNQKFKDQIEKRWKEKYEMETMSKEYYKLAVDAVDNNLRDMAVSYLDTAVWAEYNKPEISYYNLRDYYRKVGYTYYEMERYDSSVLYYHKALETNVEHIKDDDMMVLDYDNVGNLYSWLEEYEKEKVFDELENALSTRLRLDTLKPNLYYLGISTTTGEAPFEYSDNDVVALYSKIDEKENLAFRERKLIHLKNPDIDQIQASFLQLVDEITEDDILIVHMAGPSYTDTYNSGLLLQNDSLSLKRLFSSLSYINALQTICIADMPDINFVQEYVSYNNRQELDEDLQDNVLILSPDMIRLEANEKSAFINAIVSGFEDQKSVKTEDLESFLRSAYKVNRSGLSFSTYTSGKPLNLYAVKTDSLVPVDTLTQMRGVVVSKNPGETDVKQEIDIYAPPKDYALLFACNEYSDWSDLSNPINDAEALEQILTDLYGFEVELVVNATKDQITQKIKEYKNKQFGPQDQLLIYFAGHGYYEENDEAAYLVCKNSIMSDEEKSKDYPSYIHYSYLYSSIGHLKSCRNVFMIMDVCFGGTFFDKVKVGASYSGESNTDLDQVISNKRDIKTRLFLTSGSKEYVPDGRPGSNSPFSAKLIQALEERAPKDGQVSEMVTLTDLISYMHGLPTKVRYGTFGVHEQNGDFIFHHKVQSGISPIQVSSQTSK